MRAIRKNIEPISLSLHRSSGFADFDNYTDKPALRNALVREQRGLCCYCLSRIPSARGMKIEHWLAQSQYPGEQLSYSNLLGACMGNEGQPPHQQHCDTRKGDLSLSRNPADPAHAIDTLIEFRTDGRVASRDSEFDSELNEVLNLNAAFLRSNRKAVLDAFKEVLGRGPVSEARFDRYLRIWNGEESGAGELEPFCQVVVYWLRRRLNRPR